MPLRSDLSGQAQRDQYLKDLARYCGICKLQDDSDDDGTYDCFDSCAFDPDKTAPGSCGCGVSEANLDADLPVASIVATTTPTTSHSVTAVAPAPTR